MEATSGPTGIESSVRDRLIRQIWHGADPFAEFPFRPERVDIQGWDGSNHYSFETAIRVIRPRIIVEIGVWKGASSLHMAEALRRYGIEGVVVAVDTWLGASDHWRNPHWFSSLQIQNGRPSLQDTFMNNVISRDLQNYILPLPLDSVNAAEILCINGVCVDLIHIDGGHDFRSVVTDLTVWWPRLRGGGILIGDDYYLDGAWPEVRAAFDAFTRTHHLAFDTMIPKIRIVKPHRQELNAFDTLVLESRTNPLDRLPEELEYMGEFGPELVLFVPFCCWLSKVGLLKNRRIRTYRGMRCFYDDLDCLEIIEKEQKRMFVPPCDRPSWLPVRNEHNFDNYGRSALHFYPDLRRKFCNLPLIAEVGTAQRPLLIVHNKHNNEWNSGPVNYISLGGLDFMFRLLKNDFTIVYIRHGIAGNEIGFTEDHNTSEPFEDGTLLKSHPEVLCFDDLYAEHRSSGGMQDLNTFKNVLYSRCYRFVSSQGGGAHHIALFSGALLLVLHRRGSEEHWAYGNGYYGFMAAVPPTRAICRTEDDLICALQLFVNSVVAEDRLLLSAGSERLLARFSPLTIGQRV